MLTFDFRFADWPESPVDAASFFYSEHLPMIREALVGANPVADDPAPTNTLDEIAIVFPLADHTHRQWRLAAIQGLAREGAPRRVNGVVVGGSGGAVDKTIEWLTHAPGITGQLLAVGRN